MTTLRFIAALTFAAALKTAVAQSCVMPPYVPQPYNVPPPECLTLIGGSVFLDAASQSVNFLFAFDRVPDLTNWAPAPYHLSPEDEFQIWIDTERPVDESAVLQAIVSGVGTERMSMIRSARVPATSQLDVLWVQPLGTPIEEVPGGWGTGGWGSVQGGISFVQADTQISFSVPLALLRDDGEFHYALSSFHRGGTAYVGPSLRSGATFGNQVPAIPEPSTYALMLAGLAVVGIATRARAQSFR